MKAYDVGFIDGQAETRKDRVRSYQGAAAENDYWRGYLAGVISVNPGKSIVQCGRDGKIFAVLLVGAEFVDCPICGRRYVRDSDTGDFQSDRKLTILHAKD